MRTTTQASASEKLDKWLCRRLRQVRWKEWKPDRLARVMDRDFIPIWLTRPIEAL